MRIVEALNITYDTRYKLVFLLLVSVVLRREFSLQRETNSSRTQGAWSLIRKCLSKKKKKKDYLIR